MKFIAEKKDIVRVDLWLLSVIIIFSLSLPLLTPRIYSSDEIEYYVYLRSLYKDGDLDFTNDYSMFVYLAPSEYEKSGFVSTFLEQKTETGLRINFAPVGCSILWLPWFVTADLYCHGVNILGGHIPTDGFSAPYIQLVAYGSMVYGFLGLLIIFSFLRRLFANAESFAALLAVWFATPVVYYMYVQAPMSHSCSLFTVSIFVWYWYKTLGRGGIPRWIILGSLLGIAGLVREQNLFFIILPIGEGIEHLRRYFKDKAELPLFKIFRGFIVLGISVFIIYIPQLAAYKILYGRLGPSRLVERKMDWLSPYSWKVLFDYEHGLFFWTPVLILAVAGLIIFSIKERFLGLCLLAAFLAQVYVSGAVRSWHASGSFGHRRFINCSIIFAVGLAFLVQKLLQKKHKALLSIFTGFFILWNLQLAIQFATGMMDRRMIRIEKAAVNAVTVMPKKVVEIAGKFLFEREKMYKIGGSGDNKDKKNEKKK